MHIFGVSPPRRSTRRSSTLLLTVSSPLTHWAPPLTRQSHTPALFTSACSPFTMASSLPTTFPFPFCCPDALALCAVLNGLPFKLALGISIVSLLFGLNGIGVLGRLAKNYKINKLANSPPPDTISIVHPYRARSAQQRNQRRLHHVRVDAHAPDLLGAARHHAAYVGGGLGVLVGADRVLVVVNHVQVDAQAAQGVTILLVEQNANRALGLADRGYVMESGLITMSGDAKVMLSDPKVRAAYLGE